MMTGRDRVNTAMRHGQPERVPAWCQLSLEHILRNSFSEGEYPRTIDEYVQAECAMTLRYGFDGVVLYLPGMREHTRVDEFLKEWIHGVPQGDASHDFQTADPDAWERETLEYEAADFYSSRLARDILGDAYHIGGGAADAFSRAIQWFPTMEEAMMAMVMDTAKFAALVAFFENQCIAWAQAQIRLGDIESIHISSPYAGSSFISLETYKTLVLPQLTRLADALKPEPAFSYVHTCGFLSDRLELIASCGADGIECLDPAPLGNVELGEAKKRIGDKVFLKGNLDSVNTLLYGTDEAVDRAIMHCLEVGMPGGGYILSTACSVAPAVPPRRVRRVSDLAEQFGEYKNP